MSSVADSAVAAEEKTPTPKDEEEQQEPEPEQEQEQEEPNDTVAKEEGRRPSPVPSKNESITSQKEVEKEKSPAVELDPESDDPMKMPPHGTEVYVGGITKSATDAQIREFCEQKGQVFRLRCPKDSSLPGQNRGYAFVTYTTREAAHEAVDSLNQTEMKDFPDKRVSLLLSQVKNRLFVGNIPREITREELKDLFDKEAKGIVDVELLMDHEHMYNRGFCFLECYNHNAADLARRTLSRPDFRIKERSVTVTWAEPRKTDPDHEKVKSVYIGNLPESATENQLKDIFKAYGDIEKVVLLPSRDGRSQRDYGFVHYTDRTCALKAVEAAENQPFYLDEKRLHVSVARPTTQREDWSEGPSSRRLYPNRSRSDYRDGYGSGYPYRYSETDYGSSHGGGYPPAPYGMGNMALVPTYLPNGQVAYVFQQTPMPGAGGPMPPMGRATRPYGSSTRYRPY